MNRPSPPAEQKFWTLIIHAMVAHRMTPNIHKKKLTLQERLKKWFVHPPYGRRKNRNSIDAKDVSLAQPHPIFQNAALAKIFPTEILLNDNETKHTDSGFRLNFFRPRVPLKPNHNQCLSVCAGSLLSLDVLLRGTDVMRDGGVAGERFDDQGVFGASRETAR